MARYLADWSALARARYPEVHAVLEPLLAGREVATCGLIQLEFLFSTRAHGDLLATRSEIARIYPLIPTVQADFDRALDVMTELARRGQHRAAGPVDLVIAAVAERTGLALLHYDADYDYVAQVTGQPVEWVVPRGSVP